LLQRGPLREGPSRVFFGDMGKVQRRDSGLNTSELARTRLKTISQKIWFRVLLVPRQLKAGNSFAFKD
jgi:hypothetical protein